MKRWAGLVLGVVLVATGCAGPSPAPQPWPRASVPQGVPPPPGMGRYGQRSLPYAGARQVDYLLVDKTRRMLIAYAGGQPVRVYHGIQLGGTPQGHKQFEGDRRTPEGLYTISTRNPASRFYLSLRISYPNAADRAFAARYGRSPGGDIFLHGQPNGYPAGRVPGDWTDGCIALTNEEIAELWAIVPDGTPIQIRS
ncbi:MAG: L,D-transpeptidase family protein [Porphyrobacter sp.]|nr:L,D-transpeptidase family protein [Porphyrobacter sp.]